MNRSVCHAARPPGRVPRRRPRPSWPRRPSRRSSSPPALWKCWTVCCSVRRCSTRNVREGHKMASVSASRKGGRRRSQYIRTERAAPGPTSTVNLAGLPAAATRTRTTTDNSPNNCDSSGAVTKSPPAQNCARRPCGVVAVRRVQQALLHYSWTLTGPRARISTLILPSGVAGGFGGA